MTGQGRWFSGGPAGAADRPGRAGRRHRDRMVGGQVHGPSRPGTAHPAIGTILARSTTCQGVWKPRGAHPAVEAHPRPTYGIVVASTVMLARFASRGRLAMWTTA